MARKSPRSSRNTGNASNKKSDAPDDKRPRSFQKVRHYGFAHPRRKTDWEWLAMLVTVTLNMVYILNVARQLEPQPPNPFPGPKCGQPMRCLGFISGQPLPPLASPKINDSS